MKMLLMGPGSVSPLPADAAPTHEMAHWLAAQGHQVRVQWRAGLAAALRHMAWRPHLVWVASLSAAGPLAAAKSL